MNAKFVFTNVLTFVCCAAGMEFVAWFTQRYFMHGLAWSFYRYNQGANRGCFEKNNWFAGFITVLAIVLLVIGIHFGRWLVISAGAGVTLYGLCNLLFYNLRFCKGTPKRKLWRLSYHVPYLERISSTQRRHRGKNSTDDSVAYAILWAPKHYGKKDVDK